MTPPDNAFSYLAVLYSIILGLAFTDILQGFRRLVLARKSIVFYGPPVILALLLLLVLAQTWWAMFALRSHDHWTFASYGVILLHCIVLYMVCSLVLPDEKDLRAGYYAHSRAFFSLIVVADVVGLVRDAVLYGSLTWGPNLYSQLAIAGLAGVAAVTHNRWYHMILAPAGLVGYLAYVGLLFWQL